MDINVYKTIVLDQKKEKDEIDLSRLTERKEEIFFEFDSPLAQIIIGVRRCGKSTICHKVLKQNSIDYAFINFDDERLYGIKSEELNSLLEALYMVYSDFRHLFCDEIQNIPSWFLFINRLLRQNIHLYITGSNAKLLSNELSTHLTGRYNQIELFPFSFSEVLKHKKIPYDDDSTSGYARKKIAFEEYLSQGGFPELFFIKNKKAYIRNLFNAIIDRDIKQRFSVRYPESLRMMATYLTNTVATELSYKNLATLFSFGSIHTARNYVSYLRKAYLLIGIQKFSYKSKVRICNEKNYTIDPAFIFTEKEVFSDQDFGARLENIVCIELLRRKNQHLNDVFFFKNSYEIDFVLCYDNKVNELIQVSADISNVKTYNREINALVRGAEELRCNNLTLITLLENKTVTVNNKIINIISVLEWLKL